MLITKGIKKGKKIELLEDINIKDGEEILISVEIIEKKSEEKIRPSGLCEGEFIVPDDFDASLPEEILRQFGVAESMYDFAHAKTQRRKE